MAPDLAKRLGFYKLRAKVDDRGSLGRASPCSPAGATRRSDADSRRTTAPALGWRVSRDPRLAGARAERGELDADARDRTSATLAAPRAARGDADAYHAHRIALGVPEGGKDFLFGDAFPHEALMDQLNGVDFDKGCYVGQEVVSRMQHRGTARTPHRAGRLSRTASRPSPAPR